ncbi:hypothetical protein [Streptomyces nigrescens]|uniref:Uncharacterized protein n=1 Tax=Streptomyces nigrescens TaxID=1920 RepID=A0A640TEC2_STRNI|nr:hypothetical protein [Streptomyces libani]WAT94850.1 hypothetical protein STRLI_000521 [Streptomyces libani subsp. libani]GFE19995.1 hypothetical protein Sliba_04480 [Streptomyces libani subsp. libani]GGV85493.1 hypothetical protein GCM10010500_02010 [Streptomyces libani subsp. libani]
MPFCSTPDVPLTAEEIARLSALPDGAHEVKPVLGCELESGHGGPHWAQAQAEDRGADSITNWWLRWDDSIDLREWAHDDTCRVDSTAGDPDHDICLLPVGHAGCHSWAL